MHAQKKASPRVIGVTALSVAALTLLVFAAPVGAVNPPGNNGTIKIDGQPWDTHPNNEPHPGCIFQVDFYGFDEGDLWADVTFAAQAPTGFEVLLEDRVFIGEDDASGGGSADGIDAEAGTEEDADGNAYYDLSAALAAFEPHPRQGYHVKLTIHADGSRGADVKHKVFWVEACETAPAGGTSPASGGGDQPASGGGELPGEGGGEPSAGDVTTGEDVMTGGAVLGGRSMRATGQGAVAGALPDTSMASGAPVEMRLLVLGVAVALGCAVSAPRLRGAGERGR